MEIANFLRTVPLFTKLEDSELQRFAELTREKSYPKGSVILFADDPNFRGYWYGTNRLFLNALFFSKYLNLPRGAQ